MSDLTIIVAGDFLAQDVLVSLDPSYEFNPQGRTQDINTYKQLSGAAMLEFLLRALSKREDDKGDTQIWGPVQCDAQGQKSLLETNPTLIAASPGETITLDRCTTRNEKAEPLSSSYRQTNLLGVRAGSENDVSKQPVPKNPSCLCLSIDHAHFLTKGKLDDYLATPDNCLIVARVLYRPLSSAAGRQSARTISKNLTTSLKEHKGKKIGVVSSESLRSMGFEISYRVSWERSISDVYRHLRAAKSRGRATDYLLEFDYLVVTFYNDAALVIDVNDLKNDLLNEDAHSFIFIPSAVEGDLVHSYEAPTRGTETIVTASLAHHLTGASSIKFEVVQKAVLFGVKASRFLQVHGFVEVCDFAMTGTLKPSDTKDVDKCMNTLSSAPDADCDRYIRNRMWSAKYFKEFQSKVQGWANWPKTDKHQSGLVTWPFGDIIDIIALGELESGGFPPKKIKIEEGRLSLQSSTAKSATAWEKCGWLGMAYLPLDKLRFDDAKVATDSEPTSHNGKQVYRYKDLIFDRDLPWWSLREHCVTRLSCHLVRSVNSKNSSGIDFENVASWFLSEFIVRYGLSKLNARTERKEERLDFAIVDHIERARVSEQIRDAYAKSRIEGVCQVKEVLKSLKTGWNTAETRLGAIPELTIGNLKSINRRDMENFRVVRERLVSYRDDDTRRPLSVLVVGPPGAGKGFAVKELIKDVYAARTDIEFLTFNLANFAEPDALAGAFLQIQEAHLKGTFPVAVWDEYDTTLKDKALGWLPYFLGPMQDGNFFLGDKLRSLPKCVFVFAGSMFSSFGSMRALNHASEGKPVQLNGGSVQRPIRIENLTVEDWRRIKGRDFKSRLNAILNISGVDPGTVELAYESVNNKTSDRANEGSKSDKGEVFTIDCSFETLYGGLLSYRFRRAVALRSIFERNRPDLFDKKGQLRIAHEALITLLGEQYFDHGVRSMENLVMDSQRRWRGKYDSSAVPVSLQVSNNTDPNSFDVGNQ